MLVTHQGCDPALMSGQHPRVPGQAGLRRVRVGAAHQQHSGEDKIHLSTWSSWPDFLCLNKELFCVNLWLHWIQINLCFTILALIWRVSSFIYKRYKQQRIPIHGTVTAAKLNTDMIFFVGIAWKHPSGMHKLGTEFWNLIRDIIFRKCLGFMFIFRIHSFWSQTGLIREWF